MPLFRKIEVPDITIQVWEVSESTTHLEDQCRAQEIVVPPLMHLEERRKLVMATALMHRQLFPGSELSYLSTGKPVVSNGQHISITHCGHFLAMMRSSISCGVDLERIHPRVRKVRHKFLSDAELLVTSEASDEILTRYWTAKEAMFKVSGSDKIFMRSNIFVHNLSETEATAVLQDGETEIVRTIRYDINADMILAWTGKAHEA